MATSGVPWEEGGAAVSITRVISHTPTANITSDLSPYELTLLCFILWTFPARFYSAPENFYWPTDIFTAQYKT